MRELASGYTSEIDTVDEPIWTRTLQDFDDANIYQTWSYAAVTRGRQNTSHLLLKENGDIVAVAESRIAKLPLTDIGIAYVRWGPLWRRRNAEADAETFRQAIRGLCNEYAYRRGLVLRVYPIIFDDDAQR